MKIMKNEKYFIRVSNTVLKVVSVMDTLVSFEVIKSDEVAPGTLSMMSRTIMEEICEPIMREKVKSLLRMLENE